MAPFAIKNRLLYDGEQLRFLQGLRVGRAAMEKPEVLLSLALSVHADTLVCAGWPSGELVSLCDHRDILVLTPHLEYSDENHPSLLTFKPRELALRHLWKSVGDFNSREEWAAFLLRKTLQARREAAAGLCAADADLLLSPGGDLLRWHVACCYRRIHVTQSTLEVEAWSPDIRVPLESTLSLPLSNLDIQWELLDGEKTAARGRAIGIDDPPSARMKLQALNPDNWTGLPGLRLHFYLPALPSTTTLVQTSSRAQGDVLVLRRPAAGSAQSSGASIISPFQVSGAGPEASRVELPLRILAPVECQVKVSEWMERQPHSARIEIPLRNNTSAPLETELRVTLHRAGRRVQSLGAQKLEIPASSEVTTRAILPPTSLDTGANYVMAGFQCPAAAGLTARLIYRTGEPGLYCCFRNKQISPAGFWLAPPAGWENGLPLRVDLVGGEEKVIKLDFQERDQAGLIDTSGNTNSTTGEMAPGLLDVRTILSGVELEVGEDVLPPVGLSGWRAGPGEIQIFGARWEVPVERNIEEVYTLEGQLYREGLLRVAWSRVGQGPSKPQLKNPVKLRFPLHPEWSQVRWWRSPFWDTYPASHPDAPEGSHPFPVQLSRVERAVTHGSEGGLAILTGRNRLDLCLSPGLLLLNASGRPGQSLEFGFLPVLEASQAEGLWLRRPPHVVERRRHS